MAVENNLIERANTNVFYKDLHQTVSEALGKKNLALYIEAESEDHDLRILLIEQSSLQDPPKDIKDAFTRAYLTITISEIPEEYPHVEILKELLQYRLDGRGKLIIAAANCLLEALLIEKQSDGINKEQLTELKNKFTKAILLSN